MYQNCLRDFQEINYSILWGGHLARLWLLGGQDAHPTINNWIFFYLSVPKSGFSQSPVPHAQCPIPHAQCPILKRCQVNML